MTKEQFLIKWPYLNEIRDTINPYFIDDLEAVIAYEIEKAKGEAKPEAEQVTEQVKPKFDQDRFEAMFLAVVESGEYSIKDCIFIAEEGLKQLDAFYETKKGGEND